MTPRHHTHGILPAVKSMLELLVVAVFLMTFVAQPSRIPSASMEPTLLVGDFLLVNKQAFSPPSWLNPLPSRAIRRDDIVVFHYPVDPNVLLVKRVIGLPGDRIHLAGNRVFVNGAPLPEPFAVYRSSMPDDFRDNFPNLRYANPSVNSAWWSQLRRGIINGELTVPPGHYFVLGDNRNDSEDSRYWGFVPRQDIIGQPLIVYFSLNQPTSGMMSLEARPTGQPHPIADTLSHLARWDRIGKILR